MTVETIPKPAPAPAPAGEGAADRLRRVGLTTVLVGPAALWYLILLILPLGIVFLFSFGERAKNGGWSPAFTLDNYIRAIERPDPFIASLTMAIMGAIGCLLVGLPLAYYIATRAGRRKGLLILLLVVPFWTSFLIRTYAWLLILGPNTGLAGIIGGIIGSEDFRILGTPAAVLVGLILGYGQTYLMGNALVTDFLEARNWPNGAARAVFLILIMFVTIAAYLWFVNRGRRSRDVSIL